MQLKSITRITFMLIVSACSIAGSVIPGMGAVQNSDVVQKRQRICFGINNCNGGSEVEHVVDAVEPSGGWHDLLGINRSLLPTLTIKSSSTLHESMPARGNGAQGLGQSTVRRHRRISRCSNAIVDIKSPSIRRCARRGGVKRMEGDTYVEGRAAMGKYLQGVVRDAISHTEYAGRYVFDNRFSINTAFELITRPDKLFLLWTL
ncbi:hypothetical protein CVT24_000124 [Panaeolus cyanescens]|uniref:Uncharacterized protein n=1 Tax=Panaeolus cyanescens TaxID=181874 RepID=A0A409W7Y6_9AGAR|nr:hypothetical protein CVT24_000124 [Panaeolus cyanescens]